MHYKEASDFLVLTGNEVRLRILIFIRHEPKSVAEIVDAVGVRQSAISQHLKRLRKAGIVTNQRKQTQRFYSLAPGMTEKLLIWLEREFPARG
ncbi:metalloregulator ArsR/SmtB family transcription factor (plasmid) [Aliirhizobium terrae]|uniref:ArsR/SmtB family transcription factor n=1 Tax=Terrirhizobium terrae TaxID=2926709 RepID=UPI0025751538|nr:metalloregulator ArsR/SmtB family transcription factor [Rhizobium sp. CC-CFT758]WJH38370.1 metalloregulator ArsR/SmtB family transcription factor [Rhizobium sp. CC-CFT758]